ncbi:MAG: hypothetical protein Ct9H300mP12_00040 [Acidimicrobiales bacterium]|nr:MAG: hypothetical protein Ct9H300mP12_00040 [Acidimicrobiales bacterium]
MTGLARTAGTVAPVSEQDGTSVLSPVEEADFVTRVEEFLAAHARRLGGPPLALTTASARRAG